MGSNRSNASMVEFDASHGEEKLEMQNKKENCLVRLSGAINHVMSGVFRKIGYAVGSWPWLTVLLSTILMAVLSYGFANFDSEGASESSFVPQGTRGLTDEADMVEYYGESSRYEGYIQFPSDGGNILDKENMVSALKFYLGLYNFSVSALNESLAYQSYSLSDLCERVQTAPNTTICLFASVFSIAYSNNLTALEEDDDISQTLNDTFTHSSLELYVGGVEYDDTTALPVSAKVLRGSLFLNDNEFDTTPNDSDDSTEDPAAEAWEEEDVDYSLAYSDTELITVYPFNAWAFTDVVGSQIVGDVKYQGISYFIIIFYVVFVMQNSCSRVKSSVALALLGVLTIGYAIICGFGFSQLLGFTYGYTHTVLVFIILGIGADGVFIVTNAFRRTNPEATSAERAADALQHAGVSVTVSSLTNVVAFALGSTTVIPDLSSFCKYAALTFFFLWIFLPTFFTAILVLNERRVLAGRLDVFCCFHDCCSKASDDEVKGTEFKPSFLSRIMGTKFADVLMNKFVRYPVFLLTIVCAALAGWNITNLTVAATTESFIPDDSYLKKYVNAQDRYFGGEDTDVYVITKEFDYYENRAAVAAFPDEFRFPTTYLTAPPYIRPTFTSWIEEFMAAMADPPSTLTVTAGEIVADSELDGVAFPANSTLFYKYLRLWLDDDYGTGPTYESQIVFTDDDRTQIERARISMDHVPIGNYNSDGVFKEDATECVKAMNKMYEICDDASFETYPYSSEYSGDWASYEVVAQQLKQNVLLALLAVFVMIFLFIGHPLASTLVFVCVGISIVELLGFQTVMGLSIDTTSVVLFVLSVGVAVDYSAHIGYAYMTFSGTPEERLRGMLADVAVPVLHGAMSTFLAVLMQAFSESYVFRVMFRDFAVIVSAATLNGLIVLPMLLYTFNPPAYSSASKVAGKTSTFDDASP
mmetsp:Transcript_8790/g.15410  ORF Transcript_8790/g.15410 Transcript_8790/m.15410 type:complete len:927 (-) Transcript_8790:63-2843(-)|eukprot:CAMPEP_0171495466 /NCGR_PEP_ID=MMETSP0958-20121227/6161_1 /TAXON_ID=87120 /ORGANISM="Aurantiochytrium limacinum, Strain ATCCMYA-1381" /LENGTH=926 /DNA_ID=CAMNT_0012029459 /DNA_START=365 /DNA_END=3145 /DNA_ORIENTATION=+